jgi:hypothetical protein
VKLSAGVHGEIRFYGKVVGGIGEMPAALIVEPDSATLFADYTPTTGLASGVITSVVDNQVTVAGAGWVPGELRGRAVDIAGNVYGILSNSATVLEISNLDVSYASGGDPFILKDWSVQLSVFDVADVQGRVEMYGVKVLDAGFYPVRCSNLYLETCLLQDIQLHDCGEIEFYDVTSTGYGFEAIRVGFFHSMYFGCNAGSLWFGECLSIEFDRLVALGGFFFVDCLDVLAGLMVARCGGNAVSINRSKVRFLDNSLITEAGADALSVFDDSMVYIDGQLRGTANYGYGMAMRGLSSTVMVSQVPTLTANLGEVSVEAGTAMTWADLWDISGDERSVVNQVTGSRVFTPLHI